MTAASTAEQALDRRKEFLRDWEDLYSHGAGTLALHMMREATEAFPQAPEFWFLRGQSALATHDPRNAKECFAKAQALIGSAGEAIGLSGSRARAISACLKPLVEGLENKTISGGPREPWGWLDNPSVLGKANPSIADRMASPLGRREPLMPLVPAARGTTSTGDLVRGKLCGQLAEIELKRDSLQTLLGRDHGLRIEVERRSLIDPDLKIERGSIRIMDGSVSLAKPELPRSKVHVAANATPAAPVRPPAPAPPPRREPAPAPAARLAKTATAAATVAAALPQAENLYKRAAAALSAGAAVPAKTTASNSAAEKWDEWERRIEALAGSGRALEALQEVDEALARFPQSSRIAEIRAETLARAGRLDEAAREWVETYRKARQAGANERADRAFAEVQELARENGDLLMDLAGLAAATGAAASAGAAAKLAADLFRRRNDRKRLHAALQRIAQWMPHDTEAAAEMRSIEAAATGALAGAAASQQQAPPPLPSRPLSAPRLPTDETGAPKTYDRVAPPSAGTSSAPERSASRGLLTEQERRERARNLDPAKHAPAGNSADPGFVLLVASIVVLLIGLAGSPIPGILGYLVAHGYVSHAAKKDSSKSHMTAKFARFLCAVAVVVGFVRCS